MKFQITIDEKEMYRFNLYHTYHTANGILSILVGIAVYVVTYLVRSRLQPTDVILYLIVGTAFLLYYPVSLYMRSKMQIAASGVLKHPLTYEFKEEGIFVSSEIDACENDGETMEGSTNSALLPWKDVYKIITNSSQLLIYSSRVNAYVLPLSQIGEGYDGLKKIISEHVELFRLRLR